MSARLHPNGLPAVVIVSRRHWRGEVFYSAVATVGGRICLQLHDRPSALAVQLDALEWGQRQGKEIEWEYKDLI